MQMSSDESNGWIEYKKLVFYQLELQMKEIEKVNIKLDKVKDELTAKFLLVDNDLKELNKSVLILKTKAGVWGAVAGFIIATAIQIIMVILK